MEFMRECNDDDISLERGGEDLRYKIHPPFQDDDPRGVRNPSTINIMIPNGDTLFTSQYPSNEYCCVVDSPDLSTSSSLWPESRKAWKVKIIILITMMLGFPVLPRPVQSSSLWPGPRKVKIIIIIIMMLSFPAQAVQNSSLWPEPSQEKSMDRKIKIITMILLLPDLPNLLLFEARKAWKK